MRALLLGTAAGGGFPQWNCACRMCTAGLPARTQDCLAVSAGSGDHAGWYLVNASPDIRSQVLAVKQLAAGPGPRDTPIRGALLTDAELDHTLGLAMLREGAGLRVWAPDAVLATLREDFPLREIVARYGAWEWLPVGDGVTVDGLRITAFPVSAKRPKYVRSRVRASGSATAGRRPARAAGGGRPSTAGRTGDETGSSPHWDLNTVDGPWVVAYRIEAGGAALVYAPCLATWPDGFDELVAGAGCVILDGTFYSADEMSGATRAGVGGGAQRAMGHLPIAGADGSLARIAERPGPRWLYTHLNNTNPVLDPASPEYAAVRAAGADAPPDGTEINL